MERMKRAPGYNRGSIPTIFLSLISTATFWDENDFKAVYIGAEVTLMS